MYKKTQFLDKSGRISKKNLELGVCTSKSSSTSALEIKLEKFLEKDLLKGFDCNATKKVCTLYYNCCTIAVRNYINF